MKNLALLESTFQLNPSKTVLFLGKDCIIEKA